MSKLIKPMKAVSSTKVNFGHLPANLIGWFASGKIDGLRCTVQIGPDGKPHAYTNSLKLHTNTHVQHCLSRDELVGLDGELVVDGDFHKCSGELRRREGKPDFVFWVFDYLSLHEPFVQRLNRVALAVDNARLPYVKRLVQYQLSGSIPLAEIHDTFVDRGFEGVCIRQPLARYKQGRSSTASPECIKIKDFYPAIGTVVGWYYLQHNTNEAEVNELGLTKRSHQADGKVTDSTMLGGLEVQCPLFSETFGLGSGFTHRERKAFAFEAETLIGRKVLFKYQSHGSTLERPRSPIYMKLIH